MSKLDLQENKTLKLNNLVIKELRGVHITKIDFEIEKFINQLQVLKAQSYGPIVTKLVTSYANEEGNTVYDYDIYYQVKNYKQYESILKTQDELKVTDCLFLNFKGDSIYLPYAYSKIELHLFENDLSAKEEVYSVLKVVDGNEDKVDIDLFKPVIR